MPYIQNKSELISDVYFSINGHLFYDVMKSIVVKYSLAAFQLRIIHLSYQQKRLKGVQSKIINNFDNNFFHLIILFCFYSNLFYQFQQLSE